MRSAATLDPDLVRRAPKVLLHDHLDGGLRPATIIELAAEQGYDRLPSTDPGELGRWFRRGADQQSLELYLETFEHTVGVLQTRAALVRVAAECAEDLATDGIVYAEVRHAPELSTRGGLSLDAVVEAILEGFRLGAANATAAGRPIVIRFLASAMRQADRAAEIAQLALRYRDAGVVGFDIAGPEAGYPPGRFAGVFHDLVHANFHLTLHAGEGYGLPSIREALDLGAERLGHGVRIVDDIEVGPTGAVHLGRLAAYVRDRRIPLELCPTSNVHTGAVGSIAAHPIDLLRRLRFRVTVNTDNRLMSDVSLSSELIALDAAFGLGLDELEWLTLNAMKSAFLPFDERLALITDTIKPGFAALRRAVAP
ncbi:MAG: adenosine deaminase [Candidatus Limnocylindrales bacterium]